MSKIKVKLCCLIDRYPLKGVDPSDSVDSIIGVLNQKKGANFKEQHLLEATFYGYCFKLFHKSNVPKSPDWVSYFEPFVNDEESILKTKNKKFIIPFLYI